MTTIAVALIAAALTPFALWLAIDLVVAAIVRHETPRRSPLDPDPLDVATTFHADLDAETAAHFARWESEVKA